MMKSTLFKKILPIFILLAFLFPGCTPVYQISDGENQEDTGYGFGAVLIKGTSSEDCPIVGAEIKPNVITIKMPQGPDKETTGSYWISGDPGTYTLQVSAPGFEPKSVEVQLEAGKVINKDIWLKPEPSK